MARRWFSNTLTNIQKYGGIRINYKALFSEEAKLKQNIIHRKCKNADIEQVLDLYKQYTKLRHEVDQIRYKKNEHSQMYT